jgi:hypothetical protein
MSKSLRQLVDFMVISWVACLMAYNYNKDAGFVQSRGMGREIQM